MKTKVVLLITVAFSAIILLGFNGCASVEKANTISLLSAAGFRVRTPETPRQKKVYAMLTDERLQRATVNGKVFYVFKDEKDGIAYVGHEPEYQRYKELAVQQRIAQDYYMAAEMNSYYARGWYGAWGPRGIWW
jgi:hypothetical protein